MSNGTKVCSKCHSEIPAASLRCRECGTRWVNNNAQSPLNSKTPLNSKAQGSDSSVDAAIATTSTSNKRTQSGQTIGQLSMNAGSVQNVGGLSLDDMLQHVEDAQQQEDSSTQIPVANNPVANKSPMPASNKTNSVKNAPTAGMKSGIISSPSQATPKNPSGNQIVNPDEMNAPRKINGDSDDNKNVNKQDKSTATKKNASGIYASLQNDSGKFESKKRVPGTRSNPNLESSIRGGKRNQNKSGTLSHVTISMELQNAVRTAIALPAPEIAPLEVSEVAGAKKVKTPSASQQQKLIAKLIAPVEKKRFDDTKTTLDETREVFRTLTEIAHPDAVNFLISFVGDERPAIPESAIKALGDMRTPDAFESICRGMLSTEVSRIVAAILSLGTLGDRRAVGPLLVCAKEYPQFSLRVMDALLQLGPGIVPSLIEFSEKNDTGICLNAVIALGKLKDNRALQTLSRLVQSPSMTIRCHAVEALGEIGDEKATRFLAGALSDEKAAVRVNACSALAKLKDSNAGHDLMQCLNDEDHDVIAEAARALGDCQCKESSKYLVKLLDHEDKKVLLAACEALGKLGDESTAIHLGKMLYIPQDDSEHSFLMEVIDSLRRLKSKSATPYLLEMLKVSSDTMRKKVVDALGMIADHRSAVALEELYEQERVDDIRASICKALGEIRDPESFNVLTKALEDMIIVRIKAVIALGQLKEDGAILYLTPLLQDPSPELRYHATTALAEMGKPALVHQIEMLVLDENVMVQRGAFKALTKLGDKRDEKTVLKDVRKRSGKKSASMPKMSFDFSMLMPDTLAGMFDFSNPKVKWSVIGGSIGALVLCGIIAGILLTPRPEVLIVPGYPSGIDLGQDGSEAVLGRSRGLVQIWNGDFDRKQSQFEVHPANINSVIGLGKNHFLATGNGAVYEVTNGTKKVPDGFSTPSGVSMIKPTKGGSCIYSLDNERVVRIYDIANLQIKSSVALPAQYDALEVAPQGDLIGFGASPGVLVVINTKGEMIQTFTLSKKPLDRITAIAFSLDSKMVAVASAQGTGIMVYSMETGKLIKSLINKKAVGNNTHFMAFRRDSRQLISFGTNASEIWDFENGEVQHEYAGISKGNNFSLSRDCNVYGYTMDETSEIFIIKISDGFGGLEEITIH